MPRDHMEKRWPMPYDIRSNCSACNHGDEFVIGLWPDHLGLYVCRNCRELVNVPLTTGSCKCGHQPAIEEYYDYAGAIPYFGGQSIGQIEPGPDCPKCGGARLTFEATSHFNVGRLGTTDDNQRPWIGKDYLEKAIFVYALMAVCAEFELDPEEILQHYNLDVPASLIAHRRLSLPILLDIRNHLKAAVMAEEATFTVTDQLHRTIEEEMGDMLQLIQGSRKRTPWWQFWK